MLRLFTNPAVAFCLMSYMLTVDFTLLVKKQISILGTVRI